MDLLEYYDSRKNILDIERNTLFLLAEELKRFKEEKKLKDFNDLIEDFLLKETLKPKCQDDQYNLNDLCKKYDFIKVDDKELIFKNFSPFDKKENVNAVFVSYPGSITLERMSRHPKEYIQFFYIYILFINIALLALFPKKQNYLMGSLLFFTTFYAFYADKSCTTE
jgi:hypothetical protein